MSDNIDAGSLILSQLRMFSEAVKLFANELEPAILKGIDACMESYAADNDWGGKFMLCDDYDCWLAPTSWETSRTSDADDNDLGRPYKARFVIDSIKDDDDYWTALFCGVSSGGGEAGFSLCIDYKEFGGKNAWNACMKATDNKLIAQLNALGFRKPDKGELFLPVRLDAVQLANSWKEYGEFTKDDECFKPLVDSLDKLKQSVPLFDAILKGCAK